MGYYKSDYVEKSNDWLESNIIQEDLTYTMEEAISTTVNVHDDLGPERDKSVAHKEGNTTLQQLLHMPEPVDGYDDLGLDQDEDMAHEESSIILQ